MKINEIHIEKFGNISDLDLKLKDRINFFYGLNESDKTTITDFIIVMFYGTVNSYKEDIRDQYIPDDGSDMSGSILFEYNGKLLSLYRQFNSGSRKKDIIIIKNLDDDMEKELPYDMNPGEYLFKINKDMFKRNSYINESESVSMLKTSHTKIMTSLLSNLIATASEEISVSGVATKLNSYSDVTEEKSFAAILREKKERLAELKEERDVALVAEKNKLNLQKRCMELQEHFNHENKKFEKLKANFAVQEMMEELEKLRKTKTSYQDFLEVSESYNKKLVQFKKTKIEEYRKEFDASCDNYEKIKEANEKIEKLTRKKQNLNVELGRYMPKEHTEAFDSIVETQKIIEEKTKEVKEFEEQIILKEQEKLELKNTISRADEELQMARNDLERFEIGAQRKIDNAEEKLHNTSQNVELEPTNKNGNLILPAVILIAFLLALVIFINNIFAVIIIAFGIISCICAIAKSIKSENKNNVSRVDENLMRSAQLEIRNLNNQLSEERDKHNRKITIARKNCEDLNRKDLELSKKIDSLKKLIDDINNNIEELKSEKSAAGSQIPAPDPKFFSIKSEISDIDSEMEKLNKEIEVTAYQIFEYLAPMKNAYSFDEAVEFIDKNKKLIEEITRLENKLSVYSSKEKSDAANAEQARKIKELEMKISVASGGREIKRLPENELRKLKHISHRLLEDISKTKDEYINAITNMKIQYNDAKSVAVLDNRIDDLEADIKTLEESTRSVKYAIDTYNESLKDIRNDYAPFVARRTSEILSELTKGKYTSIAIKSGKIVVKDKDKKPLNFETISKATCDQIYFSLRLAVAEITSKNMPVPIVLDDIFLRFNETKAVQLLNFLINYSEDTQVMIFSNHNQISGIIAQNQIPIENINMVSLKNKI